MPPHSESPSAKFFIASVILCGGAALCVSAAKLLLSPPHPSWLILGALTLLSGLFTIRVPSISATISVSETFIFTAVLLFGSAAATVIVAFEALVMSFWRHRHEPRKVLFNATQPALSIWLAATLFFLFVRTPLHTQSRNVTEVVGPMIILAATYFGLNSGLTATAVGLVSRVPAYRVWSDHFSWLSLNYLVGASVALMIVQSVPSVGFSTLGIILPLLALSYFTMKSAMGRLDDANRHIAQVEQLYLSTVESLAMAVDAKDQVTHGHIRRVQALAIGLANELGVKDATALRAIEAAALLHDMGKLAIPEHILNKPGKLTTSEFETMKLHASIGADILSSIDFPYPVVPIVRHHHENWDGSGYPDGLAGASIPIGARILSVVDCFDALTSDRPYRRSMIDSEALVILQERRGTMYDPLVVDRFIEVFTHIRPVEQTNTSERTYEAIISHNRAAFGAPGFRFPAAKTSFDMRGPRRAMLAHHLQQLFRNHTCAVYAADEERDELRAVVAVGAHQSNVAHNVIAIGEGVSGWVAANRQIIVNADPILDFGHNRTRMFKYCVSSPIIDIDNQLVGVLTIYSDRERISDDDCAKIEEATDAGAILIALNSAAPSGMVTPHT